MEPLRLELTPVRTTEDAPLRSRAYQEELRELEASLQAQGFKISIIIELIEAAGVESQGMATYLSFVIELAHTPLAGVIGAVVGAWLHARYGRRVRLKVGDIEVEAQSEKQVRKLLGQAEEFQKRQSKVIHEP